MKKILMRNKDKDLIEIEYNGSKAGRFTATATRYLDKEQKSWKSFDVTEYVERLEDIGFKVVKR